MTARFDSLDAPVVLSYRPPNCGSDLDDDAEQGPGLQITGDVVTRRPEMPYLRYPPQSLLNESTTSPYFPTVVDHAASAR